MTSSRRLRLAALAAAALNVLGGLSCAAPGTREADGPRGCFETRRGEAAADVHWRICLFDRGLATLDLTTPAVIPALAERSLPRPCFFSGRHAPTGAVGSVRLVGEPGACLDGLLVRPDPISCRAVGDDGLRCRFEAVEGEWVLERSAEADERLGDLAGEAYARGRLEGSLRYTIRSLRREPEEPRPRDLARLVVTLRALDRDLEADAMALYGVAFLAGLPESPEGADPDLRGCFHLMQNRPPSNRIVRSWGTFPKTKEFAVGIVVVRAEIHADARLRKLEVLRARTPAAAQMVSEIVAGTRISKTQVGHRDVEDFPIRFCAYWDSDSILRRRVLPTVIRGLD